MEPATSIALYKASAEWQENLIALQNSMRGQADMVAVLLEAFRNYRSTFVDAEHAADADASDAETADAETADAETAEQAPAEPAADRAKYIATAFGIHQRWRHVHRGEWDPYLNEARLILAELPGELVPKPTVVFRAFRYLRPSQVRVVILGQDPYPNPDNASGLAFSSTQTPMPASLRAIIGAVTEHGLSAPPAGGDLTCWANQGVLLLNTALTTTVNTTGAHLRQWSAWTRRVLEFVAREAPAARFFLWGSKAAAYADIAPERSMLWRHPSPLVHGKGRFEACDHFARVPEVDWDLGEPRLFFTDGACRGNGTSTAAAGGAVVAYRRGQRRWSLGVHVEPRIYELVDPGIPTLGFRTTARPAAPSNNRGEYLAWCWALLAVVRTVPRGVPVEIVSDCKLFIMTMTEWLPRRRREGKEGELKNYDLVSIAEHLLSVIAMLWRRPWAEVVTMTHCRGHQSRPAGPGREYTIWEGNDAADELAGAAVDHPGLNWYGAAPLL